MSKFKVGVIQIDVQNDRAKNMEKLSRFIDEAAANGAQLVSMPEDATFIGTTEENIAEGEPFPGPASQFFSDKAKKHKIWIHCGSYGTKDPGAKKIHNTSLVMNPQGEIVARYDKIHLFDVDLKSGPAFKESAAVEPGKKIVVCDTEFCKIGLSVCYDMRFPELYRILTLRGAKVLFVPACYTMFTGKDHWEVVLRTRAIENQCYVVAADQVGRKKAIGLDTYGRSMVINPWGTVIAQASDREEVIYADIDTDYVDAIRAQLPCLPNRQPETYVW